MTKHTPLNIIFLKKAFFWDFDGCVCDSEEIHFEAYAKAFRHFGHEVNKNEYFRTFTHTGGGIVKEMVTHHLNFPVEEIKSLKAQYYAEFLNLQRAKLFPEIPSIVKCLQSRGIKSFIASNSPASEITTILGQQNAQNLFDGIVGLEKGLKKKPAPDIFLKALEQFHFTPQDVLIIEDSERGLFAAQAAQCDAFWIKTTLNESFSSAAPYLKRLTHQELLSYVDG